VLVDIFVRIEGFFKRLESYTEVQPTATMTDVIVRIIIEVLSILAIATKEIKLGRSSEPSTSMSFSSLTLFRKIPEEATRQEGYRRCAEEAGYTDDGRGSDGDRGNLKGH
jgi:hypothetical protein